MYTTNYQKKREKLILTCLKQLRQHVARLMYFSHICIKELSFDFIILWKFLVNRPSDNVWVPSCINTLYPTEAKVQCLCFYTIWQVHLRSSSKLTSSDRKQGLQNIYVIWINRSCLWRPMRGQKSIATDSLSYNFFYWMRESSYKVTVHGPTAAPLNLT